MAATRRISTTAVVLIGIATAVLLVVLVAPYANSNPDGLEKVSADKGIDSGATEHALAGGPLADYGVEGVDSTTLGTRLAGTVGIAATFVSGAVVVWLVRRRRGPSAPPANLAELDRVHQ